MFNNQSPSPTKMRISSHKMRYLSNSQKKQEQALGDYNEKSNLVMTENSNQFQQTMTIEEVQLLLRENKVLKNEVQLLQTLIQDVEPIITKISEEYDEVSSNSYQMGKSYQTPQTTTDKPVKHSERVEFRQLNNNFLPQSQQDSKRSYNYVPAVYSQDSFRLNNVNQKANQIDLNCYSNNFNKYYVENIQSTNNSKNYNYYQQSSDGKNKIQHMRSSLDKINQNPLIQQFIKQQYQANTQSHSSYQVQQLTSQIQGEQVSRNVANNLQNNLSDEWGNCSLMSEDDNGPIMKQQTFDQISNGIPAMANENISPFTKFLVNQQTSSSMIVKPFGAIKENFQPKKQEFFPVPVVEISNYDYNPELASEPSLSSSSCSSQEDAHSVENQNFQQQQLTVNQENDFIESSFQIQNEDDRLHQEKSIEAIQIEEYMQDDEESEEKDAVDVLSQNCDQVLALNKEWAAKISQYQRIQKKSEYSRPSSRSSQNSNAINGTSFYTAPGQSVSPTNTSFDFKNCKSPEEMPLQIQDHSQILQQVSHQGYNNQSMIDYVISFNDVSHMEYNNLFKEGNLNNNKTYLVEPDTGIYLSVNGDQTTILKDVSAIIFQEDPAEVVFIPEEVQQHHQNQISVTEISEQNHDKNDNIDFTATTCEKAELQTQKIDSKNCTIVQSYSHRKQKSLSQYRCDSMRPQNVAVSTINESNKQSESSHILQPDEMQRQTLSFVASNIDMASQSNQQPTFRELNQFNSIKNLQDQLSQGTCSDSNIIQVSILQQKVNNGQFDFQNYSADYLQVNENRMQQIVNITNIPQVEQTKIDTTSFNFPSELREDKSDIKSIRSEHSKNRYQNLAYGIKKQQLVAQRLSIEESIKNYQNTDNSYLSSFQAEEPEEPYQPIAPYVHEPQPNFQAMLIHDQSYEDNVSQQEEYQWQKQEVNPDYSNLLLKPVENDLSFCNELNQSNNNNNINNDSQQYLEGIFDNFISDQYINQNNNNQQCQLDEIIEESNSTPLIQYYQQQQEEEIQVQDLSSQYGIKPYMRNNNSFEQSSTEDLIVIRAQNVSDDGIDHKKIYEESCILKNRHNSLLVSNIQISPYQQSYYQQEYNNNNDNKFYCGEPIENNKEVEEECQQINNNNNNNNNNNDVENYQLFQYEDEDRNTQQQQSYKSDKYSNNDLVVKFKNDSGLVVDLKISPIKQRLALMTEDIIREDVSAEEQESSLQTTSHLRQDTVTPSFNFDYSRVSSVNDLSASNIAIVDQPKQDSKNSSMSMPQLYVNKGKPIRNQSLLKQPTYIKPASPQQNANPLKTQRGFNPCPVQTTTVVRAVHHSYNHSHSNSNSYYQEASANQIKQETLNNEDNVNVSMFCGATPREQQESQNQSLQFENLTPQQPIREPKNIGASSWRNNSQQYLQQHMLVQQQYQQEQQQQQTFMMSPPQKEVQYQSQTPHLSTTRNSSVRNSFRASHDNSNNTSYRSKGRTPSKQGAVTSRQQSLGPEQSGEKQSNIAQLKKHINFIGKQTELELKLKEKQDKIEKLSQQKKLDQQRRSMVRQQSDKEKSHQNGTASSSSLVRGNTSSTNIKNVDRSSISVKKQGQPLYALNNFNNQAPSQLPLQYSKQQPNYVTTHRTIEHGSNSNQMTSAVSNFENSYFYTARNSVTKEEIMSSPAPAKVAVRINGGVASGGQTTQKQTNFIKKLQEQSYQRRQRGQIMGAKTISSEYYQQQ